MSKILVTLINESDIPSQVVRQVERIGFTPTQVADLVLERYEVDRLCHLTLKQLIDLHNYLITL